MEGVTMEVIEAIPYFTPVKVLMALVRTLVVL
jgi:hypothetical protein